MTLEDKTIYERVQLIYARNEKQIINLRLQKNAQLSKEDVMNDMLVSKLDISSEANTCNDLVVKVGEKLKYFEIEKDGQYIGFATEMFTPSVFDAWFLLTMLKNSAIDFNFAAEVGAGKKEAEAITRIFETEIKNSARIDRWEEGRDAFVEHVRFFTARNLPVSAVLPAFPCKSFNLEKVQSPKPDMGEELAIRRILEFVLKVNQIYEPGMHFYIVSDGHVFSDCVNVDDDVVDEFTEELKKIYHRVRPEGFNHLFFKGLNECFESRTKGDIAKVLLDIQVDHYLPTKLDRETEVNRKILMLGCDDSADLIKEQIRTPGHPRLYLFRGFNKFMQEDLANTPIAQEVSSKKFKKTVAGVAYEMIRRNDAYSNLVELVFPFHLRLSIHAHHNAGPKYGIRLFNPQLCRTVNHDQDEEDRLLHIPTPWHNAVFKVSDEPKIIVANSKLCQMYDEDNNYTGGWNDNQRCYVYVRVNGYKA
ncbi:hypothetical protein METBISCDRAFT_21040 [Metschnikowia bicuspidata]|uniref:Pyoverdine/dityrosine biosynthesis protein n=1 Tax=Metschnikowia bicuspidata TaxID=27322 RepID=A0A4P9ZK21_9ASCO|nr:hypothetical protein METBISCDRAFT_21040 [Metschnikowia bicuspidata]